MTTNIELKDNECALILNDDGNISIYLKNEKDGDDRIITNAEQLISGLAILLKDKNFVNYVLNDFERKMNEFESIKQE